VPTNSSDESRSTNRSPTPFFLVDVFTDRPLQGNPVAVVPHAGSLAESQMHEIAREFNQAETTFILSPTRRQATWRLRSFTPEGKEAFGAGHNTLGAWWWLAESGNVSLSDTEGSFLQEIGEALLPVRITGSDRNPELVRLSQSAAEFGRVLKQTEELAGALGLSDSDMAIDKLPAQVVSTAAPHLLIPVRDRAAVERARPDFSRLAPILQSVDGEGCYLFTLDTVQRESAAHARFFNPTLGIIEDIATGTAAGPLACHLLKHGIISPDKPILIEQGYALHRPSVIRVDVEDGVAIISGKCVVSGEGRIFIPSQGNDTASTKPRA
jgi:trans-2,3-dihydro-3-hydroxyanthranilate isomerase